MTKTALFAIAAFFISQITNAQYPWKKLEDVSLKYFGISTLDKSLDSIELELINKRSFVVTAKTEKTDTSYFLLSGYSDNYNPFSIAIKRLRYEILSRTHYNTSRAKNDTLLVFQVVALTESTAEGLDLVKKEYRRISKELIPSFSRNYYTHKKKKNIWLFEQISFHEGMYSFPILTMGWSKESFDKKTYVLYMYYNLNKLK